MDVCNLYHRRLIANGLLILILSLSFKTKAQESKATEIRHYLELKKDSGLFNGNVLVAENGKVVLQQSFGYADASRQVSLTSAYRFHIGSIAKEFDAVGVMLLVDRKQLKLTDKLSNFFIDLPAWASKVTVLHLLQYTSGLPEIKWQTVHNDSDNWKNLYALQALDFEPGSRYAYTNNNTFLRRRLIEKVTGVSFNRFVVQNLFPRAGIKSGTMDPTENDLLIARSFDDRFVQDSLAVPISGWTCLTAEDAFRWVKCVNEFCLISPESTAQILVPFTEKGQAGLGTGKMENKIVVRHVHDGQALHYRAYFGSYTPAGRVIIILASQRNNVYELAGGINLILDR